MTNEEVNHMNGYCEDFPCCGHEAGDCNGQKYGSDADIKARALRDLDEEFGYMSDY
jgi:hypothetical protein